MNIPSNILVGPAFVLACFGTAFFLAAGITGKPAPLFAWITLPVALIYLFVHFTVGWGGAGQAIRQGAVRQVPRAQNAGRNLQAHASANKGLVAASILTLIFIGLFMTADARSKLWVQVAVVASGTAVVLLWAGICLGTDHLKKHYKWYLLGLSASWFAISLVHPGVNKLAGWLFLVALVALGITLGWWVKLFQKWWEAAQWKKGIGPFALSWAMVVIPVALWLASSRFPRRSMLEVGDTTLRRGDVATIFMAFGGLLVFVILYNLAGWLEKKPKKKK